MNINDLTYKVIGSAYKVHNVLGPGFLEKVYENALTIELRKLGIHARQQEKLPVLYEGEPVGVYYPDFWIENQVTTAEPENDILRRLSDLNHQRGLLCVSVSRFCSSFCCLSRN